MELSKWRRRKYVPLWGENRTEDEPVVIVFIPPTIGWMGRYRELSMSVPRVSEDLDEHLKEDEFVERLSLWSSTVEEFRGEFLGEHIVAVESLTLDGRAIDLEEAVSFIEENEGLREEIFKAIIDAGSVSRAQGKD